MCETSFWYKTYRGDGQTRTRVFLRHETSSLERLRGEKRQHHPQTRTRLSRLPCQVDDQDYALQLRFGDWLSVW